jgi:hypothetical protein
MAFSSDGEASEIQLSPKPHKFSFSDFAIVNRVTALPYRWAGQAAKKLRNNFRI